MLATDAEYRQMVDDRPEKFKPNQVGFRMKARDEARRCDGCVHWYQGRVAKRNVCEITTGPDPKSRHIPAESDCDFWTADGKTFPYRKKGRASEFGRRRKASFEPVY